MAIRKTVIDVCDRCDFTRAAPSTQTRQLMQEDAYFELKLCDVHARMFDRDIAGWARLAREIDPPRGRSKSLFEIAEDRRKAEQIKQLAQEVKSEAASTAFVERRAAEIDFEQLERDELLARQVIPGALKWRLTDHARERMVERGFTIESVLRAAATPAVVVRQPWRGAHVAIHQLNGCRVVVNDDTHAVITVIDRSATLETAPPPGDARPKESVR